MSSASVIAIDAMGGDAAPAMVIDGLEVARERQPELRFIVCGDEAQIAPLLARHAKLKPLVEVRHTTVAIESGAKPSAALRQGRQSSMWLAIDAVKQQQAVAAVSAGNTGALVGIARFVLRTLPGIDKPAMASFFPTLRGETVMLDLGAIVDCSPENLLQFALLGSILARAVLGVREPTVGLLNIGVESLKGREDIRAAAALLAAAPNLHYHGFVEGDDITKGTVDVVVTDGFTGNVALKTAEGTASFVLQMLRQTVQSSTVAKLGFLMASRALRNFRVRMDPRRYNGAVLLGLDGICVKSHGGTDAFGFAHAVEVAAELASQGYGERIAKGLAELSAAQPAALAPALDALPAAS